MGQRPRRTTCQDDTRQPDATKTLEDDVAKNVYSHKRSIHCPQSPALKRVKVGQTSLGKDSKHKTTAPAPVSFPKCVSRALSPDARPSTSYRSFDSFIDDRGDPANMSRPFTMRPFPRAASVTSLDRGVSPDLSKMATQKGHLQKMVESVSCRMPKVPQAEWSEIVKRLKKALQDSRAERCASSPEDDLSESDSGPCDDSDEGYSSMEDADQIVCDKCKRGDDEDVLLICEGCNHPCHTYCVGVPLHGVPDCPWFCRRCTEQSGVCV